MFYNVDNLSEREQLENDINGFLKVFNKEYQWDGREIELTASRVLLQNVFDLIERIDRLDKKGNRWFKFKKKENYKMLAIYWLWLKNGRCSNYETSY